MAAFGYDDLISTVDKLEKEYGIPSGMYRDLIMKGERSGPQSVSPKGAIGYAQLMPGTARDMGVENVWDPEQNLRGGAKYLKTQYDRFKDWRLGAAAYNAGPENVKKAGGVPDFPETKAYLERVLGPMPADGQMPNVADDKIGAQATADLQKATAHAGQVQAQAEQEIAQHGKQASELAARQKAAHDEPLPLPPLLRDMQMPPDPKDYIKDPKRVMGQFLPAMLVLGSMFTKHAARNAMVAAGSAMDAAKQNDRQALDDANTKWKEHMEALVEQNRTETDRYITLLNRRDVNSREVQAELQTLAALDNNSQIKAMVANGQPDQLYKFLQAREMSVYRLAQVADFAAKQQVARDEHERKVTADAEKQRHSQAMEALGGANAAKMSPGQKFAQLLAEKQRILKSGDQSDWTSADEYALEESKAVAERSPFGPDNPVGDKSSKAVAKPPPPNPSKDNLVDGQLYSTPQGPATWDAKKGKLVY